MKDTVEFLRNQANTDEEAGTLYSHELLRTAANEIEYLREQLATEIRNKQEFERDWLECCDLTKKYRKDAQRYSWLVLKMQEACNGNDLEMGNLVIGCSMQYEYRKERCVLGLIRWIDVRDEPLNLDAAIDTAMQQTEDLPMACGC